MRCVRGWGRSAIGAGCVALILSAAGGPAVGQYYSRSYNYGGNANAWNNFGVAGGPIVTTSGYLYPIYGPRSIGTRGAVPVGFVNGNGVAADWRSGYNRLGYGGNSMVAYDVMGGVLGDPNLGVVGPRIAASPMQSYGPLLVEEPLTDTPATPPHMIVPREGKAPSASGDAQQPSSRVVQPFDPGDQLLPTPRVIVPGRKP